MPDSRRYISGSWDEYRDDAQVPDSVLNPDDSNGESLRKRWVHDQFGRAGSFLISTYDEAPANRLRILLSTTGNLP